MPKIKTHKGTRKRIRITRPKKDKKGKAKFFKKTAGRDHFNARESGKITKRKRRDYAISKSYIKSIKELIPHR